MAVVVLVNHGDILDVGERFQLAWVAAEARVIVQGAFAESLQVVCITVVEVVLAVVIGKRDCAIVRGFHLVADVCDHLSHLGTLSCRAVI